MILPLAVVSTRQRTRAPMKTATTARYTLTAMALHWLLAIAIVAVFGVGLEARLAHGPQRLFVQPGKARTALHADLHRQAGGDQDGQGHHGATRHRQTHLETDHLLPNPL